MTLPKDLELLWDQKWRLNNLYQIKDAHGQQVTFKLNDEQTALYDGLHYFNIILKARQLGITTFFSILFLDLCLWNENVNAAIIADRRDNSQEIFQDKVKFAYDRLPEWVKDISSATRDNKRELRFRNGSVFRVGTTLRSGTVQFLHISEMAKICKEFPDKAKELVTGAINCVHEGQFITIESTAEGREGAFYDICQKAIINKGKNLSTLDFKFWFFSWWTCKSYKMNPHGITYPQKYIDYFTTLETKYNIYLDDDRRAWYVKKGELMGDAMFQEYPSHPEEAFFASNEGRIYGQKMAQARQDGRVGDVHYNPNSLCYTSWDIGYKDDTSIWVYQFVGSNIHFIDYYHNDREDLAHYVKWLRSKDYMYAEHYVPHDAASSNAGTGKTYVDVGRELGVHMRVLPRESNEMWAIERVRSNLHRCYFDESKCADGIRSLEAYKREWNDKLGCYRDRPLHDWSSHASKAIGYVFQAPTGGGVNSTLTKEELRTIRKRNIL